MTHLVSSQTGAEVTWGLGGQGGAHVGGGALERSWVAEERGQQATSSRVEEGWVEGETGWKWGAARPCCPGTGHKDEAGPGAAVGSSLQPGRARRKSSHPGRLEGPPRQASASLPAPPSPMPTPLLELGATWTRKGWAPKAVGPKDRSLGCRGGRGRAPPSWEQQQPLCQPNPRCAEGGGFSNWS